MEEATKTGKVILLHGDDILAIQQELLQLLRQSGLDSGLADLNAVVLEDRSINDDAIYTAAGALPMFSAQRVVVLKNPVFPQSNRKKGDWDEKKQPAKKPYDRFLGLLGALPGTTRLIIVIYDEFKSSQKGGWQILNGQPWLSDWARDSKSRLVTLQLPPLRAMSTWISNETTRQGGKIAPNAAAELAMHFGNDTQVLAQEIGKLLTYVNVERPIEVKDVQAVSSYGGLANIFNMTDAVAEGNAPRALQHLHQLMEGQDILSIFSMIVRQFRLLIQTRDILDEHGNLAAIAHELHLPEFVADNLILQSRRFATAKLESIYRQLLEMDFAAKNGGLPLETALDMFIVDLVKI